nr:hypothetical protein [Acidobacteriota bacterium]
TLNDYHEAAATMQVDSVSRSSELTLQRRTGQAYSEDAFRYLLETERRRAEHSRRPILLLLVNLKTQGAKSERIAPAIATAIFGGLWLCVREVDFVGWFREGRVAGVVLSQGGEPHSQDVPRVLGERIAQVVREHVSSAVADRLHVRVLQLRSGGTR